MQYKNDKTKNRRRYKSRYRSDHNYRTKQSVKNSRTAVIVGILTFVVLASLILVFVFGDNIYTFLNNSFNHIMATPDNATVIEITETAKKETEKQEESTEEQKKVSEQSEDFKKLSEKAGYDYDDYDAEQIVFVECGGSTCNVYTYEKKDGKFTAVKENIPGYISPNGTAEYMTAYDDYTPLGNFNIEYAFGTNEDPGTKLDYLEVDYGSRWDTDPNSINYNKWIDSDATYIDFESYIPLAEYTKSYKYAVVFDYNRDPVDSSQGCAKFLHVSNEETYGGVGISESELVDILKWLDPEKYPKICIFNK